MRKTACILLAALVPLAALRADEDRFRIEERIPEGSLALFTLPDVQATGEACSQLALSQLLAEPECRALFGPICAALPGLMEESDPHAAQIVRDLMDLLGMVHGQVAVALIDVDPAMGGLPILGAAIDFGPSAAEFKALLDDYRGHLGEAGMQLEEWTMDGGQVAESLVGGPLPLHHTMLNGVWLLSTHKATLTELVAGRPSGGQRSLAASERFQGVASAVAPTGCELMLYADVEALMERFGGAMPPELRGILGVVLDGVAALGYGMDFQGREIWDRIHIHAPGERRGLMAALDFSPARHGALNLVPASAWWYSTGNFDLDRLMGEVLTMAHRIEPEAEQMVQKRMAKANQFLGMRLREDFLQTLGSDWSFYGATPEGGGLIPELGIIVSLKDAPRFEIGLKKIVEAATRGLEGEGVQLALKAHQHRGMIYHSLDVDIEDSFIPFFLRPCVLVTPERAVFTLVPHTMKAIIERIQAGGAAPPLAENPEFRSLLAGAAQGHFSFEYLDLSGLIMWLYNAATPIAQALLHGEMLEELPFEIDLANLPSAHTVARHMSDLAAWGESDARGLTMTYRSPVGLVGAMVPLMAAALVPTAVLFTGGVDEAIPSPAEPIPHIADPDKDGIGIGPVPEPTRVRPPRPPVEKKKL